MNETYFEILVYTCTQKHLAEKVEREVDSTMHVVPDYGNGSWEEGRELEIQRLSYPVRFNEVVGAIEIHRKGSQLRADWWFTGKEKVRIGSKSTGDVQHIGKLLEKHYSRSRLSSSEIFRDFREALGTEIARNRRLKRRFVDFDAFDRCGPHIDWRSILELDR